MNQNSTNGSQIGILESEPKLGKFKSNRNSKNWIKTQHEPNPVKSLTRAIYRFAEPLIVRFPMSLLSCSNPIPVVKDIKWDSRNFYVLIGEKWSDLIVLFHLFSLEFLEPGRPISVNRNLKTMLKWGNTPKFWHVSMGMSLLKDF